MPGENKQPFLKTKYYPVDVEKKQIINLPFDKENHIHIVFKGLNFIGIKGRRLNEHQCYSAFTIREFDFEITGERIENAR